MRRSPLGILCHKLFWTLRRGIKALWEVPSELSSIALGTTELIRGARVVLFDVKSVEAEVKTSVGAALDIIQKVDARRFARIHHDVARFLVADAPTAGYWLLSNTCLIPVSQIGGGNTVKLALTIVYGGACARISRAGIRSNPDAQARIARRCTMEQITFLCAMRDAGYDGVEPWIARYQQRLTMVWWTEQQSFVRMDAKLQRDGAPSWIVWLHALVFRPRGNR